jgi:uncharacterized protein (TIGR02266 family)
VERRALALTGTAVLDKRELPFEVILGRVYRLLKHPAFELRTEERKPFFSVVEFSKDDQQWCTGFSYDVSSGGIFVRTLTPMPPLTQVQVRLRFLGQQNSGVSRGVVAWANPFRPRSSFAAPVGMGIRLVETSLDFQRQIEGLVRKSATVERVHAI